MHSFIYYYIMASMRVSICVGIAIVIWFLFNVNHGYYIPMTVMIIYAPFKFDLISGRMKSRLFGVFLGVLYGVLVLQLLKLNENVILIIPVLAVLCLYYLPRNYTFAAMIITIAVVCIFGMTDMQGESPFAYGIARVNDTFIAALICVACEYVFITQEYIRGGVFYRLGQVVKAQRHSFKEFLNNLEDDPIDNPGEKLSCFEVESIKQSVLRNGKKLQQFNIELFQEGIDAVNNIAAQIKVIKYLAHTQKNLMKAFKNKHCEIFEDLYQSLEDIDHYAEIKEKLARLLQEVNHQNACSYESVLAEALSKISNSLEVIYKLKCKLQNV